MPAIKNLGVNPKTVKRGGTVTITGAITFAGPAHPVDVDLAIDSPCTFGNGEAKDATQCGGPSPQPLSVLETLDAPGTDTFVANILVTARDGVGNPGSSTVTVTIT